MDSSKRPWGAYQVLRDAEDFKAKLISVDVGQAISYQYHSKRREHWIIVSGKGEVVLNDFVMPVSAGQHIFVEIGVKHRIRNTGTISLRFVEVQLGTYFGEDDIVRLEDDYNRCKE